MHMHLSLPCNCPFCVAVCVAAWPALWLLLCLLKGAAIACFTAPAILWISQPHLDLQHMSKQEKVGEPKRTGAVLTHCNASSRPTCRPLRCLGWKALFGRKPGGVSCSSGACSMTNSFVGPAKTQILCKLGLGQCKAKDEADC